MRSAVSHLGDGSPCLELTAQEYIFPISVEQGGEDFTALFHMAPYSEAELIQLLDESSGQFRPEGRSRMIMEPGLRIPFTEMFDRHFIQLAAIEGNPTVEEQKAWLDRHERLKQRVIQEGYAGGEIVTSLDGSTPHTGLRLSDVLSNNITISWNLWSEKTQQAEKILLTHVLRPETREDYRKYTRATSRLETHTRKGLWKVLTDNKALGALYNDMVEQVEGCVVEGIPCSTSNKNDWISLIPYWHKVAVVYEVFAGGSAKNV